MIHTTRTIVIFTLVMGLTGFFGFWPVEEPRSRQAWAQDGSLPPGVPPPVDRTASLNARRELEAARIALQRAEANLPAMVAVVTNELTGSDAYREAVLELRRTQNIYNRLRKPIRDELLADPEIQADLLERFEAEEKLRQLFEQGDSSFATINPLALQIMNATRRIINAETIALATEPSIEEARQNMQRAAAQVRRFRESFRTAAPADPRVRAVREDIEAARRRVERANQALAEALQRESNLERQRNATIERLKREGRLPRDWRD